jgi:TonB family protein
MFETLFVSHPAIRTDGRAGLVAVALHLVVPGLAAQPRPRADAPVTAPHEPVRFYLYSTARTLAAAPAHARVDRGPELATPLQPKYPAALRAAGLRGEVVIEYVVGEDGRVDTSSVRAVRFTHPDFVPPIRAALASARFIPAQRSGGAIAVRVRQRVAFQVR